MVGEEEVAAEEAVEPSAWPKLSRRQWMVAGAVGGLLVVGLALGAGWWWARQGDAVVELNAEALVVEPKGPPPPVSEAALADYELVVGTERYALVGGMVRLPSGEDVKVVARSVRSFSTDHLSFEYSPILDVTQATEHGSFEVTVVAPDGSSAKLYPIVERLSPEVVIGHLKFGLLASSGASRPVPSVARRVGGKAYMGDALGSNRQEMEFYVAEVKGIHRVVAAVYHPAGTRAHEEIDRLLASVRTEQGAPAPDFDISVGTKSVSVFCDEPHGLEISGVERLVSIGRLELAHREFQGLSFQADASLALSEIDSPLMPALRLLGKAYYVQLVTSPTLSSSDLVDAITAAVPGAVARDAARNVGTTMLQGKKFSVPMQDGLVYQAEVYAVPGKGREIALVVEYAPISESSALDTFQTVVETLQ